MIIECCLMPLVRSSTPSICDTGPDGTPEIVKRWLPTGTFRARSTTTFSGTRAQPDSDRSRTDTLANLGWDRSTTWLLFLDADMVLGVSPDFRREDFREDVYRVMQRNGSLEYPNVRLARSSLDARFVGATHEHFSAPAGASESLLETLKIEDRNDGGSRSDKYERDGRLLEGELERDPGNVRAMFYLAQTCRGMGDVPESALLVPAPGRGRRWLKNGGTRRRRSVSSRRGGRYPGGRARIHDGDPARPRAAGGLLHLAYTLRALSRPRFAHRVARAGLALGLPANRSLFIDRDILELGLLREISINAFYTPWREEGLDANEKLGLGRGAPASVANLATANAIFYAEALPAGAYVRIAPRLPAEYVPCNPSILRREDGYLINCRAVSYRMDAYQAYSALEPDGVLRTKNVLIRTDRELGYVDQQEVVCQTPPLREAWVRGPKMRDCSNEAVGSASPPRRPNTIRPDRCGCASASLRLPGRPRTPCRSGATGTSGRRRTGCRSSIAAPGSFEPCTASTPSSSCGSTRIPAAPRRSSSGRRNASSRVFADRPDRSSSPRPPAEVGSSSSTKSRFMVCATTCTAS
jgi:hypothetical protein